jgi:methylmalonyl-CoA mutase N-terminal domain/subunit
MEKRAMAEDKFFTGSGIEIKPYYTPEDLEAVDFHPDRDLGAPGQFPYTRGIDPEMYRKNHWVMGQYAGFGTAEEANQRYKFILSQGAGGFSLALDLPTQLGYDSDHPLAKGEVGKIGVAIDTLRDMEIIFDGIRLDRVKHIRTTANAIGPVALAMFIALCEKQGVNPGETGIIIQNDILKEFVARGTQIFPPRPSLQFAVDAIEYSVKHFPSWEPLMVCGYHYRDAGANAVQEVALTFANARAYIEAALQRGVDIDAMAPRIRVHFGAHMDLFEEIAKLRAARRMWARMMKEYGAKDPQSLLFRHHSGTIGGTLVPQQPLVNIVRVTIEALSAILGGSQSLRTSSYDEAYAIPTEEAERLAIRTQQVIAHESGITKTIDPLAGSYYVETLTCQMETKVQEFLKKIGERGGAVGAIENGFIEEEIVNNAYRQQKEIESGERVIVGLNRFKTDEKTKIVIFKGKASTEQRQIDRLRQIRQERNNKMVGKRLEDIKDAASRKINLVEPILSAVREYATVQEICDVLKGIFGEYQPAPKNF